jgi:hypothetical protein
VVQVALALRELREQAGLSLRELGKRALYDYTRLSRAEHGEILIPEAQVRALDKELNAGGLLVALRQAASGQAPAVTARPCSVTGREPVILEIRMPGGGSITLNLSRRQFTQVLTAGALAAAFPGAGSPDDAARTARALGSPPGSTARCSATSVARWMSSTRPTRCSAPAG